MKINRVITGLVRTCSYIVEKDDKVIIIDASDKTDRIIKALDGKIPDALYLTHGHFDHVLGAFSLKEKYPKLKIYISKIDSQYLKNKAEISLNDMKLFTSDLPLINNELDLLYYENENIDFKVFYTPGHTEGSVCFLLEDENILFSGDTVFKNGYGRYDLHGGNKEKLFKSIDRLLKLDKKIVVLPGHGENTTISELSSFFL